MKIHIKELIKMLSDFYGKEFTESTKENKLRLINNYRKVEKENNDSIIAHGSVDKWYASGDGRILNF